MPHALDGIVQAFLPRKWGGANTDGLGFAVDRTEVELLDIGAIDYLYTGATTEFGGQLDLSLDLHYSQQPAYDPGVIVPEWRAAKVSVQAWEAERADQIAATILELWNVPGDIPKPPRGGSRIERAGRRAERAKYRRGWVRKHLPDQLVGLVLGVLVGLLLFEPAPRQWLSALWEWLTNLL